MNLFPRELHRRGRVEVHMSRANPLEPVPQRVWQKCFYDFNVWTEGKRAEASLHAPQSGAARHGGVGGAVALEQLPRLFSGRTWAGGGESVGRP
jgi:hypothetical protein